MDDRLRLRPGKLSPLEPAKRAGQNVAQGRDAAGTLGSGERVIKARETGGRWVSVAHSVGLDAYLVATQGLRPGLYAAARLRGLQLKSIFRQSPRK